MTIPEVPAAIVAILGLIAPYAIALVNRPEWSVTAKRIVSMLVPIVLAAVALVLYFAGTGEPVTQWPQLVLLAVVVTQASHSLITRETADKLERATSRTSDAATD